MNKFKSSAATLGNLYQNGQHMFALNHSMMIYEQNALYSLIPKNGCSTIRLSIAIANGCINGIEQGHWIHANNGTFKATIGEAIKADYTFVILRCPFARLASVYLDKMVSKEPDAWQYRDVLQRKVSLNDLTFREFVLSLRSIPVLNANIHWRPQSSFLLLEKYHDYFSLERFSEAIDVLKSKINLDVIDARSLTNHGTDKFQMLTDQSYADTPAFEIAVMQRNGKCPSHRSLYDQELIDVVTQLYQADITLYQQKFGASNLLFP